MSDKSEGKKSGSPKGSCVKKCERKKLAPFPNKIMVKSCKVQGLKTRAHPCDPPKICDPEEDSGGECPQPVLCLQKLKNPMKPEESCMSMQGIEPPAPTSPLRCKCYFARCKEGSTINVASCKGKVFIHPCDQVQPCTPGEPKKEPCPEVALCRERIKNPAPVSIRCPSPHDLYSKVLCENIGLWQDPPICDPEDEKTPKEKSPKDKNVEEK